MTALHLNQSKYGMELLLRFRMSPMTPGSKLSRNIWSFNLDDIMLFPQMVGCLQYLTMSRPYICYVINQVVAIFNHQNYHIYKQ